MKAADFQLKSFFKRSSFQRRYSQVKKQILLFLVFTVCAGSAGLLSSFALDGKQLFDGKCGSCHGSAGTTPAFAPTKFASAQWQRFFEREKHQRKKDISSLLTAEELKVVQEYLMSHAAVSDRPEAVGLR